MRRWLLLALAIPALTVSAQARLKHPLGEFEHKATANGILLAAPHGSHDTYTPGILYRAAGDLGSGYLIARHFQADKRRINVNRPTEGAQLPCAQEQQTDRAQEVYAGYLDLAKKAAGGAPLRLYVEIHGNAEPRSANHLEVGAVGFSAGEARAAKAAYGAMLAAVREETPGYPALELLMEPADRIYFGAGCSKKLGILGDPIARRAIHFEFPRSAREPANHKGSAALVAGIVRVLLAPN
ncbi:MAG: hypothetical protein ACT4P9_02405 [Betaproteobacteria bacterium]